MHHPSPYEQQALKDIHAWKNPAPSWFRQTLKTLSWPLDTAGDLLMATPGIGKAIEQSVSGIAGVAHDVAQWSVRPDAIYAEFHAQGIEIRDRKHLHQLDLEVVDGVVSGLDIKYQGLAAAEGAATGAVGLPGLPADMAALITLDLRAIGEYATYYGFAPRTQHERLFALNVLGLASSPNGAAKGIAMAQLVRIATDVATRGAWKNLQDQVFGRIIRHISQILGLRLLKAKFAQVIPVTGAVVGGGFNAYYTAKVCMAAYHLYRERFLARKYGPAIIERTVTPATDLDPAYEEEDQS